MPRERGVPQSGDRVEEEREREMRVVKDVFRRKGRSFLTISGITIGVLALVVMGAMASKIDRLVDGGVDYYGDKVTVQDAASKGNMGIGVLDVDRAEKLREVEGVAAVSNSVFMLFEESDNGVNMGMPPIIMGQDYEWVDFEDFELATTSGRTLKEGDKGVTVVGADLAKSKDVAVGDTLRMRGKNMEVVGILDKTLTMPDNVAYVSLAEAQEMFHATLPEAMQAGIDPATIVTEMVVYPEQGVDPDGLAKTINDAVDGVSASGPTDFVEEVKNSTQIFNAIVIGIGLVSLLVGGLSVVNTMMMSVSERVREIGIRKAIGASTGSVVRHFIGESAVIGLIGGLLGLGLGAVVVTLGNAAGAESGNMIFLLTVELAVGAVAFATVLGVLAGTYPAIHAARLDPVVAFRRG